MYVSRHYVVCFHDVQMRMAATARSTNLAKDWAVFASFGELRRGKGRS
jgi:hypothetical protein